MTSLDFSFITVLNKTVLSATYTGKKGIFHIKCKKLVINTLCSAETSLFLNFYYNSVNITHPFPDLPSIFFPITA